MVSGLVNIALRHNHARMPLHANSEVIAGSLQSTRAHNVLSLFTVSKLLTTVDLHDNVSI